MPAGGKPTVRSRRFGRKMQRHRVGAGFDQTQAAEFIHGSRSKISRMEDGITTARPAEVLLLLDRYGVTDETERGHLVWLAKNSGHRGWWLNFPELSDGYRDHISLEDDATFIREWQTVLVPGLLQTPAYAEQTSTLAPNSVAPEAVARYVKVREERQAKIEEGGTSYSAIVWEPIVTIALVPDAVHREQLEQLLKVGRRSNVSIQVLPVSAGVKAGVSYPFSSFSFDSQPAVEAVAIDNLRGASILEATDDLTAYARVFDRLRSEALSPDSSARLVRQVLRSSKEEAS
ncbi:helix-turn-helix transcriptional regulator [Streptomyces sp. JV176]|uniref:helix-turn-helix domain-containing protein n=1 Tax=Streptomyces sp. JV176 TaxID=858630 RepID=UPI002E79B69C|nr:helix-turn-helix transcriptional regulator [Streptomyces sp. JV176]MEE1798229.1 helix-turn-helix transcriptional regulator [Streptomyces sp. JV176]